MKEEIFYLALPSPFCYTLEDMTNLQLPCPICGKAVPMTKVNRIYCGIHCRRKAERLKIQREMAAEKAADEPLGFVLILSYAPAELLDKAAEFLTELSKTKQMLPICFVHPDPIWEAPDTVVWMQDDKTNYWNMMAI